MSKSYTQIYMHIIFHVGKNVVIYKENEVELYAYVCGISKNLSSPILKINGTENHIHILCSLSPKISVSDYVNKVKSNSSKWMKNKDETFCWQRGYGAFSVSSSVCPKVSRYVEKQKDHHQKISYLDELKMFLEHYHLD